MSKRCILVDAWLSRSGKTRTARVYFQRGMEETIQEITRFFVDPRAYKKGGLANFPVEDGKTKRKIRDILGDRDIPVVFLQRDSLLKRERT